MRKDLLLQKMRKDKESMKPIEKYTVVITCVAFKCFVLKFKEDVFNP